MTLVVGLHLGTYALVAADSRKTTILPDGSETIDDSYRKVHLTNSGIVAGSGLTLVTEWVVERMKKSPKAIPTDLGEAMQARHTAVVSQLPDDPRVQLAGARTGFILTTRRRGTMEVELYQSEFDFRGMEVNVGFPISLLPVDAGMDVFEPHLLNLKRRMQPLRNLNRLEASLDYHLGLLKDFMRTAVPLSATLGPSMQVGYCTSDGDEEVTDLISLDS